LPRGLIGPPKSGSRHSVVRSWKEWPLKPSQKRAGHKSGHEPDHGDRKNQRHEYFVA